MWGLVFALASSFFVSLLPVQDVAAQVDSGSPTVYELSIRDDVKSGTVYSIRRAIERASDSGAEYLVITLDTPGGLLDSTRKIVDLMQSSEVPVVVYVDQASGWAFSAGTIILLASDVAAVHPTASIGAAQPFTPGETNETQDEKTLEATTAWVRGLAAESGRDEATAQAFVQDNLTLRGDEALNQGIAEVSPASFSELLEYLEIPNAERVTVEPSVVSQTLNVVSSPYLISLFLTLGSLALILSVRSGEFEFTAVIGIVFLLIGLWGIGSIEYSVLGLGLLLLGAVLIAIELFDQPGFGLFGLAGIGAFLAGALTLNDEPFYDVTLLSSEFAVLVAVLIISVLALGGISKAVAVTVRSKPVSGKEAMIGAEAIVSSANLDRHSGRVNVDGASWAARLQDGEEKVPKGTKVCIMDVKGNTLVVSEL